MTNYFFFPFKSYIGIDQFQFSFNTNSNISMFLNSFHFYLQLFLQIYYFLRSKYNLYSRKNVETRQLIQQDIGPHNKSLQSVPIGMNVT